MLLLTTSSLASAQDYNERAQAYVEGHDRKARMSAWSDIYTDGTLYGIAIEDRVLAAFSGDELGAGLVGVPPDETTVHVNVMDVEMATADQTGWSVLPPAASETPIAAP